MQIKVPLSEQGLEDAIRQLNDYQSSLQAKAEDFARVMAEKGLAVAKIKFSNAKYAGENDVTCRVESNGNKAVIYAEGNAVAFIEFGTGVTHKNWDASIPLPKEIGAHGTYGKGKGKQHSWCYYGSPGNAGKVIGQKKGKGTLVVTSGNDAAMAMWGAVEEIASTAEDAWREVWGSG